MATKKRKKRGVQVVAVDLDRHERPDNYPSLVRYLEAQGRVKHLTYAQQMRARHLYVRGRSVQAIHEETDLAHDVIERLAMMHGWDEERDMRLYSAFSKLNKLADGIAPNVDQRHDRIAGTIETVVERLLQAHQNGQVSLEVSDLKRMADVLKTTVDVRRTIRGKKGSTSETRHVHAIELPDEVHTDRLAAALTHTLMQSADAEYKPRHRSEHVMQISVGEAIGSDREFENQDD